MTFRLMLILGVLGTIIFGAVFLKLGLLAQLGLTESQHATPDQQTTNNLAPAVILLGAYVAYFTFLVNAYFTHRSHISANALSTLQALRTDSDYLVRATSVLNRTGGLDKKIEHNLYLMLVAPRTIDSLNCETCGASQLSSFDRDFARNVDFMLNQYEYIAAGARPGAIDDRLLRETIRSVVLGLAVTFEDYIRYERNKSARTWQNLVWLCQKFDKKTWPHHSRKLGPKA